MSFNSLSVTTMRPEDILEKMRRVPFEPFRIYLSDGTQFDVRHPDMGMVFRSRVVVGVSKPRDSEGPLERSVDCSLLHITRMEPISRPSRTSSSRN